MAKRSPTITPGQRSRLADLVLQLQPQIEAIATVAEESPKARLQLWPRFASLARDHDQIGEVLEGRESLAIVSHLLLR